MEAVGCCGWGWHRSRRAGGNSYLSIKYNGAGRRRELTAVSIPLPLMQLPAELPSHLLTMPRALHSGIAAPAAAALCQVSPRWVQEQEWLAQARVTSRPGAPVGRLGQSPHSCTAWRERVAAEQCATLTVWLAPALALNAAITVSKAFRLSIATRDCLPTMVQPSLLAPPGGDAKVTPARRCNPSLSEGTDVVQCRRPGCLQSLIYDR